MYLLASPCSLPPPPRLQHRQGVEGQDEGGVDQVGGGEEDDEEGGGVGAELPVGAQDQQAGEVEAGAVPEGVEEGAYGGDGGRHHAAHHHVASGYHHHHPFLSSYFPSPHVTLTCL